MKTPFIGTWYSPEMPEKLRKNSIMDGRSCPGELIDWKNFDERYFDFIGREVAKQRVLENVDWNMGRTELEWGHIDTYLSDKGVYIAEIVGVRQYRERKGIEMVAHDKKEFFELAERFSLPTQDLLNRCEVPF